MYGRFPDDAHKTDFIESVRSRKQPSADIDIGLRSQLSLLYATMSYRSGSQKLLIDPRTQQVDNAEAMKLFRRQQMRKPWVIPENV